MRYVAIFQHYSAWVGCRLGFKNCPILSVGAGSDNLLALEDAYNRWEERRHEPPPPRHEIAYLMPCCGTQTPCCDYHWVPIAERLYGNIDFESYIWEGEWDVYDMRDRIDEPWLGAPVPFVTVSANS